MGKYGNVNCEYKEMNCDECKNCKKCSDEFKDRKMYIDWLFNTRKRR